LLSASPPALVRLIRLLNRAQGYGYSVNQLNTLLLTLFERYSQLLQRKFSGDFEQVRPDVLLRFLPVPAQARRLIEDGFLEQIVLDDDHQPMVVNDAEEFEKVVSVSWLPSEGEWSAEELRGCVRLSRPLLARVPV
jgi:hypothetical protein